MKRLAALIALCLMIPSASPKADLFDATPVPPRTLPNECAILASEAYSRISIAGMWVKVMCIRFKVDGDPRYYGHAIVVWQLHPGGQILAYDETLFGGTLTLPTTSQNCQDIKKVLNEGAPKGFVIVYSTFVG